MKEILKPGIVIWKDNIKKYTFTVHIFVLLWRKRDGIVPNIIVRNLLRWHEIERIVREPFCNNRFCILFLSDHVIIDSKS